MRNFEPRVYSYTEKSTGIKIVKAVTTYDGKVVYATAKCVPEDNFNFELGKQIALKRLEIKIAQKRAAHNNEFAKFCRIDLEHVEHYKKRLKKALASAEIATANRRAEIKQREAELTELLNTTN